MTATRFSREYGAKLAKAQEDKRRATIDKATAVLPDNFEFADLGRAPPKLRTVRGTSAFPGMCVAAGYPRPAEEYQFHPTRKWKFDYAWPAQKLAIEQEGAIWQRGGGGHSHPLGIERDIDKYNAATLLGWRILRYAPEDLALAIIDLRGVFS